MGELTSPITLSDLEAARTSVQRAYTESGGDIKVFSASLTDPLERRTARGSLRLLLGRQPGESRGRFAQRVADAKTTFMTPDEAQSQARRNADFRHQVNLEKAARRRYGAVHIK